MTLSKADAISRIKLLDKELESYIDRKQREALNGCSFLSKLVWQAEINKKIAWADVARALIRGALVYPCSLRLHKECLALTQTEQHAYYQECCSLFTRGCGKLGRMLNKLSSLFDVLPMPSQEPSNVDSKTKSEKVRQRAKTI